MTSVTQPGALERLRGEIDGRVITPGDADYDEARSVFPGDVDKRPAAIVRPTGAGEVARAVTIAREAGLDLSVRSGGHSAAGHGLADDGIAIDLSEMDALEIDAAGRTAWAEAGLTAGEYSAAVGEHGLATGFGDAGSVGLGGITLGGGVGFLSRLHGLTIDNLLAAEIVTADGEVREIDAEREPDLFWAIRGGGGNFGVVTRFRFALEEVPEITGGMLILPATPETVSGFVAAASAAPEALGTIGAVMPAPPMPFIPEELHGEAVLMVQACFAGPPAEAERALAPIRALGTPLADMLKPMAYADMFEPLPDDYHPAAVIRTMYADGVETDVAATIIDRIATSDAPMRVVQLRPLGGAIDRVAPDATAYAHRGQALMVNVASFHTGEDREQRQRWVDELAAAIGPAGDGAYVNFLGDEGPERVRAAYPGATWDRLVEVKRRWDPDNLFRSNQNIPPG